MKADTITKLPLARFARILGVNPLHFAGVQIASIEGAHCNAAWFQHNWQSADRVSREEVAGAIRQAEDTIENLLHYRLIPSWEEQEFRPAHQPYQPGTMWLGGNIPQVEARWKHVISGGRRATDLVAAGAPIVWSNQYPPAEWEGVGTVQVTVADGVEVCELALYYPGRGGDDRWRIRPAQASIVGNTATITFARELALDPDQFENIAHGGNYIRPAAGTDDSNFLATVDVYRVHNDRATQADLVWFGPTCGACGGSGCGFCTVSTATGCLTIREPRMGFVGYQPATWNVDEDTFTFNTTLNAGRQADAVTLYYQAGLRDFGLDCPLVEMSDEWARTVAILAAARLDRPVCACGNNFAERWQRDLAYIGEAGSFNISPSNLNNPLGTRAGELYAWQRISTPGVQVAASA